MWTLDEGLTVVRFLQPQTRKFNYHVAVGGGVVNIGYSTKDLDLYFLPLDNGKAFLNGDLVAHLETLWGKPDLITEEYEDDESSYTEKLKFSVKGKRIDAFIV